MMKKVYIKPSVLVRIVEKSNIIACSETVGLNRMVGENELGRECGWDDDF